MIGWPTISMKNIIHATANVNKYKVHSLKHAKKDGKGCSYVARETKLSAPLLSGKAEYMSNTNP